MSRWRARNGEIYFEGRLFAREIENLPAIFATGFGTWRAPGARGRDTRNV